MAKIIIQADGEIEREIPLTKERLTIGRRAHNDVVIDHVAISSQHAVIVVTAHDVYLEDLGSTNGTKVNGQPVRKHYLQHDDVIELAKQKIRYAAIDTQATEVPGNLQPSASAIQDTGYQGHASGNPGQELNANTVSQSVAVIRVQNGASAGKVLALTKTLTAIGRPGVQVAVISNTIQGYHLTHVEGTPYPLVNGDSIDETIHPLTYDDVIDMAGTRIVFAREV